MQCEHCRKSPAHVRIDQMIDGKKKSYHLCQSCVDKMMNVFSQADDLMTAFAQAREPIKRTEENALPASRVVQNQEQDAGSILQQLKTINERFNALEEKLHQLQTARDEQTALLTQILARLSENS